MQSSVLSPITLGHNAFFGVDHLSAERGAERAAYFSDPRRIMTIIETARDQGAQGLMLSTHERAAGIAEMIANDSRIRNGVRIYPLLPYAQKYVTRANEVGMVNVVLEMLSGTSISAKLSLLWQGSKAAITNDLNSVLSALMRIELKIFRNLDVGAVFLHDAFTDLALALDLRDVFEFYLSEVPKICGATGAFATKNLPTFTERFASWGLPKPVVMTHFNKAGYHMNPDRLSCEAAAQASDVSILAMGSLASGFIRPDEAYSYLAGIAHIDGVVVGVSRPEHIEETFAAIKRHMFRAGMAGSARDSILADGVKA
jgi:urease gamma subunit